MRFSIKILIAILFMLPLFSLFADQNQEKPAKLIIQSKAGDITVYLNGKEQGKTPLDLELKAGKYHLRFVDPKGTYKERRQIVNLAAGKEQTIKMDMTLPCGDVIIKLDPPLDNGIYIDGKEAVLDQECLVLNDGKHQLKIDGLYKGKRYEGEMEFIVYEGFEKQYSLRLSPVGRTSPFGIGLFGIPKKWGAQFPQPIGAVYGFNLAINSSYKRVKGFQLGIVNIHSRFFYGFDISLVHFNKKAVGLLLNGISHFDDAFGINISALSIIKKKFRGVQIAGLVNWCEGNMQGVQFSILGNNIEKNIIGAQLSPVLNDSKTMRGFQLACFNQNLGEMTGAQLGVHNASLGKFQGGQLALVNNFAKDISGFQTSFFINGVQKSLDGTQLGLINYMQNEASGSGMQIGIINIAYNFKGFQFGAINFNKGAPVPFTLLFNYAPEKKKK